MRLNYKRLGDYIQTVNIRNKNLEVETLLGVSIRKVLMPSIANTIGTDMSRYKIINKNQFAYSSVTSRNGDKISIALLENHDKALVSQAYTVFEIIDDKTLNAEYLMMWFRRPEFDRYARFKSHGSARETFDWEELQDTELPIPSIEKQHEIVKEYNTVANRITLNETINKKLEDTAQALYKNWFVDFEFPNEQGKPYKSNGGKMVYNEELDLDIPLGWEVKKIKDFCFEMMNGGTPNRGIAEYWNSNDIPWLKTGEVENNIIIKAEEYISKKGFKNSSAKLFPKETVIMAMYGATAGQLSYLKFETTTNQACCGMICKNKNHSAYLYYYLLKNQEEIANMATGGAQPNLSKNIIEDLLIIKPKDEILLNSSLSKLINHREIFTREILNLSEIKNLLLSKMSKVAIEKEMVC
ncbi:restriction endonuclease subunit S [Tenacibaculum finnmarkense genomovar ulcerans]|uniref:restriction endonuclease subunit S n=1 Tax=Tenacibaculum finnmarkense TaxID=2781243 RepID=UPI001EFA56D3|nr:restriction endonuclease subunit S [Tenacibaculum finnmarkense]MCG8235870.1 restriction endonuclease subunit S [Tenacibaculum finnmarkense genomovar ulcerans]